MTDDERKNDENLPADVAVEAAAPEVQTAPEAAVEAERDPTAELEQQLLRLRADFENFRKRTRREKEEWTAMANQRVFEDLLVVLDHFEMGLDNAERLGVQEDVRSGFRMVHEQLKSVLGKYGLSAVDATGGAFDPSVQEAVSTMPSADVPAESVIAQTRRGYRLGDRLLRAAQVVVSSGAPVQEATEKED